ncbi:hypothetical protein ASG90_06845 [Nocardioides sp. Soil797]|nr:hypothetical protein ASG90_06845 [Nocardioides sp. Soil797]
MSSVVAVVVGLLALACIRAVSAPDEPDGVIHYDHQLARHVTGSVAYSETPPAGGDHASQWLECGAYDRPVPDELAVHSLEHGTLWITYDPGLPDDQVEALEQALPDEGILSPYDGLPAPIVLTVWNRQLHLDDAEDPRLAEFLEALADKGTAPEPFNTCRGGVRDR